MMWEFEESFGVHLQLSSLNLHSYGVMVGTGGADCFPLTLLNYLPVLYKTKFGSQNLATKFGNHLCMATKFGSQS